MKIKNVLIIGAGNIGSLISSMFSYYDDYKVFVISKDLDVNNYKFLLEKGVYLTPMDVADEHNFEIYIRAMKIDIIVSALPYEFNKLVSTIALRNDISYYDLTEDVTVKNHLLKLTKNNNINSIVMPQCGLAPGFINIIGNHLMKEFDQVNTAKLRVGALPQQISNTLKYSLTWSTNGLINEYGNYCEAIINDVYIDNLQPLDSLEHITLDGVEYEAFNTSGGLGTLAETWNGKVKNLNYKTLRYPGHCEKIKFLMQDLDLNNHRDELEKILERSIPKTTQDVIIIYCSVNGMKNGKFIETSYVKKIYPGRIYNFDWSGIQISTAAGLCAAVDMTFSTGLSGFIHQEQLDANKFLTNRFGRFYSQ